MRKLKLLFAAVVAVALLALPAAAMASDRDNDRLPDRWERKHGLSTSGKSAARDNDRDGLKNLGELRSRTDPKDADSDDDGTEDGDEDRDRDGCDNANELRQGTSPRDRDSDDDGRRDDREDRDRDGLSNGGEDRTANDPRDRDTDDDGTEDGDEIVGTVASFDAATGELTITTTGGDSFTGIVNDSTEIECETEDEHEDGDDDSSVSAAHDGDDDRSGSNSGPGSGDDSDDGEREDNSGPGSRHEHDGDEDDVCAPGDLSEGALVHEAELRLGTPAVWDEVELIK